MDIRERVVVRAVDRERLSRRRPADRVGVGIRTAIDWVRRFQETGSVAAKPMGGRRPKKIIGTIETGCSSGAGGRTSRSAAWVAELAQRDSQVDYRTVWEFVHAERLSYKTDADRQGTQSA
jgi:putative transposase